MRRSIRALAVVVGALLALLVLTTAGAWLALSNLDFDRFKGQLEAIASAQVGFVVEMNGPLELSPSLIPMLEARALVVRHPDAVFETPLLSVEQARLKVDLLRFVLDGVLAFDEIAVAGARIRLVEIDDGRANWRLPTRPSEQTEAGDRALDIRALRIDDLGLSIRSGDADARELVTLERGVARAERGTESVALELEGAILGVPAELRGLLGASCTPERQGRAPCPVELTLSLRSGQLQAIGQIARIDQAEDFGLDLSLRGGHPKPLIRALGMTAPEWLRDADRIEGRARLIRRRDAFALEDAAVTFHGGPGEALQVVGGIEDPLGGVKGTLALSIETPETSGLLERFGWSVPGLARGVARGRFTGGPQSWALEVDALDIDTREGLAARARAQLEGGRESAGLRARIDAELVEGSARGAMAWVAELLAAQQADLPAGMLASAMQVADALEVVRGLVTIQLADARWAAPSLEVGVGRRNGTWGVATGSLASIAPLQGIDLALEVGSGAVGELLASGGPRPFSEEEAWLLTEGRARARLTDRCDDCASGRSGERSDTPTPSLRLLDLQVDARGAQDVHVVASAESVELADPLGSTIRAEVRAPSLSALGQVSNRPLPKTAPVRLEARIRREGARTFAEEILIVMGQSKASGHLAIHLADGRPKITGALKSQVIHLEDLESLPTDAGQTVEAQSSPLELPIQDLARVDAQLSLAVSRLVGVGNMRPVAGEARLELAGGRLRIRDLVLRFGDQRIRAHAEVDARPDSPLFKLRAVGAGPRLEHIMSELSSEYIGEGLLEFGVDLVAKGARPRDWPRSLDGDLFVAVRDGALARAYAEVLQIDIIDRMNPTAAPPTPTVAMPCFVVDSRIDSGRARIETMMLDTEDKRILVSGEMDLGDRTLDLLLTPLFKDFRPGTVTAAVRVGGTIDAPRGRVEPLATASAATKETIESVVQPIRRVLPRVGSMIDTARRRAARAAGSTVWAPYEDFGCDRVLQTERIEHARRGPRPFGEAP